MGEVRVTVRDETTAGGALGSLELQLTAERVSVRELIRARVHQEVRDHNAGSVLGRAQFAGLVRPTETERTLNDAAKPRPIDADEQTAVALEAFTRGHVLVLVDERQVEELDVEVVLTPASTVTFLRLVPLVGG